MESVIMVKDRIQIQKTADLRVEIVMISTRSILIATFTLQELLEVNHTYLKFFTNQRIESCRVLTIFFSIFFFSNWTTMDTSCIFLGLDGVCEVEYNTPECGYDGGDCDDYNNEFPGCKAPLDKLNSKFYSTSFLQNTL